MSENESETKKMKSFWQGKILRALFMAVPVFLLCQFFSFLTPPARALDVPIPKDISKEDVLRSNQTVKDRLHNHVKDHLALKKRLQEEVDDYIIFIDHDGKPILPDLEKAGRRLRGGLRDATGLSDRTETATNELTFTYDSLTYPWTAEELDELQTALSDFYPVAKAIYGNPAFNITVNVRKDPTLDGVYGLYYASSNEMVIRDATSLDVLCHEMIHAFRDDEVISLQSYEEGTTRAAEVEVFNQLADYNQPDENHSLSDDVYYEGLNRQIIGSLNGNFEGNFQFLRYQLSGYAWAKALIENSYFLADFNRELYSRTLLDTSVLWTESKLLDIASAIQVSVEGEPFRTWYGQQGVLNTDPPGGYFLYSRDMNTLYFYLRDQSGGEHAQANQRIQWTVYDYQDSPLSSGSGVTTDYGWIDLIYALPTDYKGRIKIVAAADSPYGTISDTSIWPDRHYEGTGIGVFGVVKNAINGSITVTSLDDPQLSVSQNIVNGFFSAPSLATVRGRFLAVFTNTSGQSFPKQFTKDASDYFLLIPDDGYPTQYQLTTLVITSGGGSVSLPCSGGCWYNEGLAVQLAAIPAMGYIFTGWSGDASGSTNPLTITMDSNKNITANFTLKTYTLNVSATNGTVVKNPEQANYTPGSSVQLTATPDTGYIFTGWSGDASGSTNQLTITMDSNKNIAASFAASAIRISGVSPISYFFAIQDAFNAVVNGDTVEACTGDFTETLSFNRDVSVTMKGGYDSQYANNSGNTWVKGSLTISKGCLTVENLIIY